MAYDEGLAQVFRDDLVLREVCNTLRLFRPAFYDLNAYFACGQHLIQARPFERRVNVVLA